LDGEVRRIRWNVRRINPVVAAEKFKRITTGHRGWTEEDVAAALI
jgi:hypothetical protein